MTMVTDLRCRGPRKECETVTQPRMEGRSARIKSNKVNCISNARVACSVTAIPTSLVPGQYGPSARRPAGRAKDATPELASVFRRREKLRSHAAHPLTSTLSTSSATNVNLRIVQVRIFRTM